MAETPTQLTCRFTLVTGEANLELGIQFDSGNTCSYGGFVTVNAPAQTAPVVTGLWDSDGNVFFTIYQIPSTGGVNAVINSGSIEGTFEPYVVVQSQNGLSCQIVATGSEPSTNTFDYNIVVQVAADQNFTNPMKERTGNGK